MPPTSAVQVALRAALHAKQVTYSSIAAGSGINRRTLSRLNDGADVSLTVSQIEALHGYLASRGFPFLHHANLAAALQASDRIQILLPVYHDPKDKYKRLCSPWDIWAADEIRSPARRPSLADRIVLQRLGSSRPLKLEEEPGATCVSHICIGSPRATDAEAFGDFCKPLTALSSDPLEEPLHVPVKFYWRDYSSNSPYVYSHGEVPKKILKQTDFEHARAALIFDDGTALIEITNLDDPRQKHFDSYAIVLARRLANGAVRAVVAGLTGPATAAAARLFLDLEFSVPVSDAESPLALYVIQARITASGNQAVHDDLRTVATDGIKLVRPPLYLAH